MTAKAASAMQYGMHELRTLHHRYASIALLCAVLFHLTVIGVYYALQVLYPGQEIVLVLHTPRRIDFFAPPPSIATPQQPQEFFGPEGGVRVKLGVPVPVPDAEANPENDFASQSDLPVTGLPLPGGQEGSMTGIPGAASTVAIDADPDPVEFIPVEKLPALVKVVQPEYPELARRAQVEGTVYVRLIVGKDGKPRKPQIVKSDADIFNEPAIAAAMQCLFTPALMNNGPVAVWLTIPFKFKLQ
jgi:protein TonB